MEARYHTIGADARLVLHRRLIVIPASEPELGFFAIQLPPGSRDG